MASNFIFKVTQILKRNPDGSYATQAERRKVLKLIDRDLQDLGYKKLELHNLKSKHLKAVIDKWSNDGLGIGTVKNRAAHIRWLLAKINKSGLLPSSNTSLGIPKRVYVTNEDKSRVITDEQLNQIRDPYLKASFRLQAAFGLRREESMKIRLKESDKGTHLHIKNSKGGRPRSIPITTKSQRELLEEIKPLVGAGSLIPADILYKTQLGRYQQTCISIGIDKAHGLRHNYAQYRYQVLTGELCPAKGGPKQSEMPIELREHVVAMRTLISEELGHGREDITAVYLGR